MVGTKDIRENLGCFYFRQKFFVSKEVVYPPANISFSGLSPRCPPSVVAFALCEMPKSVCEPGFYNLIYTLAFFFGKAVLAFVFFWIGQIICSVSNIEIAGEDNIFLRF